MNKEIDYKILPEDSTSVDQPLTRLKASRKKSSSDSLSSSSSTISGNSSQSVDSNTRLAKKSKTKIGKLDQDDSKPKQTNDKEQKSSLQLESSSAPSSAVNELDEVKTSKKSKTNIAKKTTNLNKSSSFDNKIAANDNKISKSIKKLSIGNDNGVFKVPYGVHPWGTMCFYETKNLKFKRELYNADEIKISSQTIFETSDTNNNINYTDWHLVLGDGFSLKKKTEDEKSVIYFRNLDEKNRYKLFVNDKIMDINSSEEIEIYNANKYLKGIDNIKNLSDAYELAKSCYVSIGIIGKFLNNFGQSFVNSLENKLTKEDLTSLPYWIMFKLNPEFMLIDNHVQKFLFDENKKAAIEVEKNTKKSIR